MYTTVYTQHIQTTFGSIYFEKQSSKKKMTKKVLTVAFKHSNAIKKKFLRNEWEPECSRLWNWTSIWIQTQLSPIFWFIPIFIRFPDVEILYFIGIKSRLTVRIGRISLNFHINSEKWLPNIIRFPINFVVSSDQILIKWINRWKWIVSYITLGRCRGEWMNSSIGNSSHRSLLLPLRRW